jgi:hypothetical protein
LTYTYGVALAAVVDQTQEALGVQERPDIMFLPQAYQ